jgi:hypothetical protein
MQMSKEAKDSRRSRTSATIIACLVLPVWFLLAVEYLGGSRYGKEPIHLGLLEPLVGIAIALALIGPGLIVLGFFLALWSNRYFSKSVRLALYSILVLSLLASTVSCLATLGGHPVWVGGYK